MPSPDGKRVAFLGTLYADALTIEDTEKLHKKREEDPVKARVTEDRIYRYWDRCLTDGKVFHIFVIDLETREITDRTPDSKLWFDLSVPLLQVAEALFEPLLALLVAGVIIAKTAPAEGRADGETRPSTAPASHP